MNGIGSRRPNALIGFGGAPFTIATYAVEGGGSKNFEKTKALLFSDQSAGHSEQSSQVAESEAGEATRASGLAQSEADEARAASD